MNLTRRLSLLVVSALIAPLAVIAVGTSANAAATGADTFASAEDITTKTSSGTTVGAGYQGSGGGAEYKGSGENNTIWFKWTPTVASSSVVDTCLSGVDNSLAIYTSGEISGSFPTVAPNHTGFTTGSCTSGKGQKYTFTPSISGTHVYYIQVRTNNGGAGAITLTVDDSVLTDSSGGGGGGGGGGAGITPLAKVTICHRTHSVTNPYVIINVSTSSVVDSASVSNGHGWHDDVKTRMGKGIFNPPYAKANLKMWGDIIPPFTADNGGTFAGLNWHWGSLTETGTNFDKTEFRAIDATTAADAGTAQYMIDALKSCQGTAGDLTAKQLYDLERKNGVKKQEILDEMEADDKASVESQLPTSEGPKSEPKKVPDQSLSGVVWLDQNRDGNQGPAEPFLPGIKVTVTQTDANGKVTTHTTYTDSKGAYVFKSIGTGTWTVKITVPSGLEVTYDSEGESDGSVDADVPSSGHASTWVGLIGSSSINAPVKNPDGTPVTEKLTVDGAGPDGKFGTDDDVTYEVDPVDGKLVLDGIPAGNYRISRIGSSYFLSSFSVGTTAYTTSLAPKKTTKAALAKTGLSLTNSNIALVGFGLLMITSGIALVARKQRGNHAA